MTIPTHIGMTVSCIFQFPFSSCGRSMRARTPTHRRGIYL